MRLLLLSLLSLILASCGRSEPPVEPRAPIAAPHPEPASSPPAAASATPVASSASSTKPPAAPPPEDVAAPLPEGFVAVPPPDMETGQSSAVLCGKLKVENLRGDPKVYEPYVVVTDTATGKKIYEAHGRQYDLGGGAKLRMELTASACGDLTGDGIAELLLTERTMGAHCCYTHYVTSLTSPTKLIMTWEKGDSGNGIWPVKLKPGKTWQVQSVDLVWPPFAEDGEFPISYADVPGFPIVFDLVGGQYQKRTFAFVDALKKERDADRAACAKRPDCQPYELYEWGMALMLGEWDAQKDKLVPDVEVRKVLERRAKEMRQKLRVQLGG